ncbi:hypothetical protein [Corallococcus sicarius]|uniref:Uncharacterized protein n=1 Tax=Corallococcus sicarius TaxID=2316726 RepID=A0A3A8N4Z9_9BACT|nr:hypothetical protein [Corallococcus sicarius]RKH39477.1 hypothetical protein D7X12_23475 [Corallococcus sicarius]
MAARPAEPELVAPRFEHIFMMPVERALAEATKLLVQHGWVLHEMEDPNYLLTEWKSDRIGASSWGWQSDGEHIRYLVIGEPLAERQSVVRIFRMKRVAFANDAELRYDGQSGEMMWKHMETAQLEQSLRRRGAPVDLAMRERDTAPWVELDGAVKGTRDLKLERDLTLRLESKPSLETLTGSLRLTRDEAFFRDPSFYLKRHRQEVQEPCEQKVAGFQPLLRHGLTVLIGEQLGTREAPAAVGNMLCEAAGAGLGVTLGLSISRKEQERIDRYVASAGGPPDQDALLHGDFWRKIQQDGRGSRAVMDLIDRARALRAAGHAVAVVAIDTDLSHGSTRDARMAETVKAARAARPQDVFLVLAGNAHTRLVAEAAWSDDFIPMSRHLAEKDPGLVVLELGYAQGRRWGCDLAPNGELECNVMGLTPGPLVASPPDGPPRVRMLPELHDEGFHGVLEVGTLSASLPAIALRGHEEASPAKETPGAPAPGSAPKVDGTAAPGASAPAPAPKVNGAATPGPAPKVDGAAAPGKD